MKIIKGNIWKFACSNNGIVIPTNGFIRNNGRAVMCAGLARQCANKYFSSEIMLGESIKNNGNIVSIFLMLDDHGLISFPIKPINKICVDPEQDVVSHARNKFKIGDKIPGFYCCTNLELIRQSTKQLKNLNDNFNNIFIPKVGCGNGELRWEEVFPILFEILGNDNKYIIVDF